MKTYSRKNSSYLKKAFTGSNFNEMCRLCLSENDAVLTPIIQNYKIAYQEWIRYSVDVMVEEGDGLPPNICDECLGMVEQTYLFKKKCKASDSKLREHFELLDLSDDLKLNTISFNDASEESQLYKKENHEDGKCDESSAVDSGGTLKKANDDAEANDKNLTKTSASEEPAKSVIQSSNQQSNNTKNSKNSEVEEEEDDKIKSSENKSLDTGEKPVAESHLLKPPRTIVKEVKRYILKGEIREGEQEEDLSVCEVVPLDVRNYEYSSENDDNNIQYELCFPDENLVKSDSLSADSTGSSEENSGVRIREIYQLWDNEDDVEEGNDAEEKIVLLNLSWEEAGEKSGSKEDEEEMEVDSDRNGAPQRHRVYTNKNQIKIIETRPQKSLSCFACSEIFPSYSALKGHLAEFHKDVSDTPFCEICGKSFTCTNSLKRHMSIHTGFKPYKCKICERKFSQGSILKRHILTHENQKPFSCHICQKSYTQKMNLLTHLKNHGFRTGAESFSCKLCSKTFVHQSGLSRHIKLHKGVRYLCVHCKKSFVDASALARHVRAVHQ